MFSARCRFDDPIIPLGLFSMLLQGAVLAYLYPIAVGPAGHWHDALHFSLALSPERLPRERQRAQKIEASDTFR